MAPRSLLTLALAACALGATAQSLTVKSLMGGYPHRQLDTATNTTTCLAGENYVPTTGACVSAPDIYTCPQDHYITEMDVRFSGLGIIYIKCTDGTEIVTDALYGATPFIDIISSETGYCGYTSTGVNGESIKTLQFTECDTGITTDTYGSTSLLGPESRNVTCPANEKGVGVALTRVWQTSPDTSYELMSFDFVCDSASGIISNTTAELGTCSCPFGVPDVGVASGCYACVSCNEGYDFVPSSRNCVPAQQIASCPTNGTYITAITFAHQSTVLRLSSFTCSDNAIIEVNAGTISDISYGVVSNSTINTTTSSGTDGFCSISSYVSSPLITQLILTDCVGKVSDTIGSASPTGTFTIKECINGEKAVGVAYSWAEPGDVYGPGYLESVDFICGTPSSEVTVAPTSLPV